MDDLKKQLAKKIMEIVREQPKGDVEKLREIAQQCKERGYTDLEEKARTIANMFEFEDRYL
jgi:hypothetical protein